MRMYTCMCSMCTISNIPCLRKQTTHTFVIYVIRGLVPKPLTPSTSPRLHQIVYRSALQVIPYPFFLIFASDSHPHTIDQPGIIEVTRVLVLEPLSLLLFRLKRL